MQATFCFSDNLYKCSIQAALHYYFQKSNQNQPLPSCRLLFIPAAALRHYTPNVAGSGRLKRVYTSKSSLR